THPASADTAPTRCRPVDIALPCTSEPGSLRYGQALGEQLDDVAPGPLGVPRVVADAGEQDLVGPDDRVVEGVQSAAVDHHAPIDAPSLHLGSERVPLRGRHDRVFRPDPGP